MKKRIKNHKPYKRGMFFLDVPIYAREICVMVGLSHKEALQRAKRQVQEKTLKSFLEALNWETAKNLCEATYDEKSQTQGAACRINDERYFLFLKPFKNDWEYLDTLNHECFHLTQFISKPLTIWDEVEPAAYLHTFLYKKLRQKLSGFKW